MTPSISVPLSTTGLKKLSKEVQAYKLFVDKQTKKALSELVVLGAATLNKRISGVTDYDGNDAGVVDSVFSGTVGIISNIGPQVGFLEFGTGIKGQSSPHPDSSRVGWNYNSKRSKQANRTMNGVEGWFYPNIPQGKTLFTSGARPYGQMLYTSIYLRSMIRPIFVGKIKRGV